jgi:hypothetical protein
MSGISVLPRLSADARSRRELGGRERLAHRIARSICQAPQSVQETQCIQYSSIDSHPNIRVAFFDAL